MYGKLAFRFRNSPAGFEPATYGIKAPNLYGIILGIIYRKKSEKSGPGRIFKREGVFRSPITQSRSQELRDQSEGEIRSPIAQSRSLELRDLPATWRITALFLFGYI